MLVQHSSPRNVATINLSRSSCGLVLKPVFGSGGDNGQKPMGMRLQVPSHLSSRDSSANVELPTDRTLIWPVLMMILWGQWVARVAGVLVATVDASIYSRILSECARSQYLIKIWIVVMRKVRVVFIERHLAYPLIIFELKPHAKSQWTGPTDGCGNLVVAKSALNNPRMNSFGTRKSSHRGL